MSVLEVAAGRGWNSCTHGGLLSEPAVLSTLGTAILRWLYSRPLGAYSLVDVRGLGPVRVGMTVAEAERAAGVALDIQGFSFSPSCYYARPRGMDKLAFMVQVPEGQRISDARQGRIVRVEVAGPPYRTLSGIRTGSSEADVNRTYPGQIRTEPHAYAPRGMGQYLTYQPTDAADRDYGVRFVTERGAVAQILAGDARAIQLIEGCS